MNTKEITLKNPVIIGVDEQGNTKEAIKIIVKEPTAGDLRGLSLKSLLTDSNADDWIKLLPRITTPSITSASINLLSVIDFTKLVTGGLQLISGEEVPTEDTQKI